jgi:hypothetical protein
MTYDWLVHAATFLILVSYQGDDARYRMAVSVAAAGLTGLCLAATVYALLMPPEPLVTVAGSILLGAVLRCRGNVAKLFRSAPHHASPRNSKL